MLGVKLLIGVDEATTDDGMGGGTADVGGTDEVAGKELDDVTAPEEGVGVIGMLLFTTLLLLRALVVLANVAAAGGVDVVVDVVKDFVVVVVFCCVEAEDALLVEAD